MNQDFSQLKPEDLERLAREMRNSVAGEQVTPSNAYVGPVASPVQTDPYAVTGWGSSVYDFVVPSGQMCQLKRLRPEELIGTGLLDKLTRLPGLAEEQIQKAEGKPPKGNENMSESEIMVMLPVINQLVCLVVKQPKVLPDPPEEQERIPGQVYVSDIDLFDRVAIMERVTGGVRKMDNFRPDAGVAVQRVVDEPIHGVSS